MRFFCGQRARKRLIMRHMFKRRALLPAVLCPFAVGLAGLAHLMSQPRFAAYRTVDVVQMTGSGACFGIALMALIIMLKLKRE